MSTLMTARGLNDVVDIEVAERRDRLSVRAFRTSKYVSAIFGRKLCYRGRFHDDEMVKRWRKWSYKALPSTTPAAVHCSPICQVTK